MEMCAAVVAMIEGGAAGDWEGIFVAAAANILVMSLTGMLLFRIRFDARWDSI